MSSKRVSSGARHTKGDAYEKEMAAVMMSQDEAIIWRSLDRALCSDKAESVYAAMIDSSIMICCCMRADSSVQRP